MSSPRFGLPHLSEDAVAAFADGVLSAAAASRAQRHCAECVECADAVRGQRETAMMLRAAQAPPLPSGLLDRLAGLPMSTPLPPSRGGLPTVLGADGTAMFVAHDIHKARDLAREGLAREGRAREGLAREGLAREGRARELQTRGGLIGEVLAAEQPEQGAEPAPPPARPAPAPRRGALPVTVLASAAAVVAAGTFGGHASTLAAAERQPPAGAANAAGSLAGSQNVALRLPGLQTGALLSAGRSAAGPASTVTDQASGPGTQPVTSLTLARVRHPGGHRPAAHPGAAQLSAGPAGSAAGGSSARSPAAGSSRTAAERPPAGTPKVLAGTPAATP